MAACLHYWSRGLTLSLLRRAIHAKAVLNPVALYSLAPVHCGCALTPAMRSSPPAVHHACYVLLLAATNKLPAAPDIPLGSYIDRWTGVK